jgi:hypothetical protein
MSKRAKNVVECPDGNAFGEESSPQIAFLDNAPAGRSAKFTRKRILLIIIFSMLALIVITRLLTLRHGLKLHPDEIVFFSSASSLFLNSPYHVYKLYPEGAFLMQMPFQMARQLILLLMHYGDGSQLYGAHITGRFAAVFYFSLGAVLGCTFLYQTQKKTLPILLFAGMIVFSLFQIEQSRYGTGEAPSFFLMMAILNLLVLYLRSNKVWLLYVAAFATGVLGAVKYPQLYFILLPIGAVCLNRRSSKTPLAINIPVIVVCTIAGLICFSPSLLKPGFLNQVMARETNAYLANPNIVSAGTPLGHLLSLSIYHLFYADVPFAPVFAIVGVFSLLRKSEQTNSKLFFAVFVPLVFVGFFLYNLFITTLFFRTYYLYFCLFLLYSAIGLSELLTRKRFKPLLLALLCVMVLRGGYLTALLTQPQKEAGAVLYSHEKWSEQATVTFAGLGFVNGDIPSQATQLGMNDAFVTTTPSLEDSEFCVIGGYQYGIARNRIFEIKDADVLSATNGWNSFREQNEPYRFDQLYPDYYYYLFGYWLEGSMGTLYEFPSVYYYYKPATN